MAESIFDQRAGPGKGFYCESGQTFNTIHELEEALLKCSSEECKNLFDKHTAGYKNDFAAWIGDVFGLQNLARKIFPIKNPVELSEELKKYESELAQKESQKEQKEPVRKEEKKNAGEEAKKDVKKEEQKIQAPQTIEVQSKTSDKAPHSDASSADMDAFKTELSERTDRADHSFDRVKKLKQHSFFNKADFEDSIEDIKGRYEELVRIVSTYRKEGNDMSIPNMMLRNVHPKIIYFQISQNKADHDMIVELLDEIEQEIKYARGVKKKDLKEEIMEALGFSKIQKEEQ